MIELFGFVFIFQGDLSKLLVHKQETAVFEPNEWI